MRTGTLAVLAVCSLAIALLAGCATRTVSETVVDTYDLDVYLRSEKPTFGRKTIARGFDQPVQISPARLEAILGGIQIDVRQSDHAMIRERQYAIPKPILSDVAEGLSTAFAVASPDQQIVVMALRKQMQKGIFNRKYLTSLIAWIDDGRMHVHLSRVDWKTDQQRPGDRLPVPVLDEYVMPFSTVGDTLYATEGRQGVTLDWQSEAFGSATIEAAVGGVRSGADTAASEDGEGEGAGVAATDGSGPAPDAAIAAPAVAGAAANDAAGTGAAGTGVAATSGSTAVSGNAAASSGTAASGGAGAAAAGATAVGAAAGEAATRDGATAPRPVDSLMGLDAASLRALADLEEARANGSIDAAEYEARRRAILEAAR